MERDRTARQVQFSATAQNQLHRTFLTHYLIHVDTPFRSWMVAWILGADSSPFGRFDGPALAQDNVLAIPPTVDASPFP
jgi:hypothetical protein